MNENIYYVYIYLDPRKTKYENGDLSFEHEPFYVGKGKNKRAWAHLYEKDGKRCKNFLKIQKLKRIADAECVPVILFYKTDLDENTAMKIEAELIARIGTKWDINNILRGPLTNMTSGGDGYTPCEELRIKQSERSKGERNPNYGVRHSDETKKLIGLATSLRRHSEKTLKQMSAVRSKGGKDFRGFKWILIKPDGERIMIDDLKAYCRENKLPYNSLYGSFERNKPIGLRNNGKDSKVKGYQLILDQ